MTTHYETCLNEAIESLDHAHALAKSAKDLRHASESRKLMIAVLLLRNQHVNEQVRRNAGVEDLERLLKRNGVIDG